jgi:hypothetical protein
MVSKTVLALVSQRITDARAAIGLCASNDTFGGLHVILSGDFHQHPPIAVSPSDYLYDAGVPSATAGEHQLRISGRRLFESFQEVVTFEHTIKEIDQMWATMLQYIRTGTSLPDVYTLLHEMADISNPPFDPTDWTGVPLISWHPATRDLWNHCALRDFSFRQSKQIYCWSSRFIIEGDDATFEEVERVKRFKLRAGISIPNHIALCEGARVTVIPNATKRSELSSGIMGSVVEIVLDQDEGALLSEEQSVTLSSMPFYILVLLDRRYEISLPGLPPNVVPIRPVQFEYQFQKNITEWQLPIVPAFAMPPFRVHGQTVKKAILDLAVIPTRPSLTSIRQYNVLSRFDDIGAFRLLRPLDLNGITSPLPLSLTEEEVRISQIRPA